MNIYSNRLGQDDLTQAAQAAGLYFEKFETIHQPRIRRYGWNILLGRPGSRRRFNTGSHGGGEVGAASRDDWGRFLATLYELDSDLRVPQAGYSSRDSFHAATRYAYDPVR